MCVHSQEVLHVAMNRMWFGVVVGLRLNSISITHSLTHCDLEQFISLSFSFVNFKMGFGRFMHKAPQKMVAMLLIFLINEAIC